MVEKTGLSDTAILRLKEEKEHVEKNKKLMKEGFKLKPVKNGMAEDLSEWRLEFLGRPDTIWEGPVYKGSFIIPKDYPTKPPKFIFDKLDGENPLQHVNIYKNGEVCIRLLTRHYSQERTLLEVAEQIEELIYTPNGKSAANTKLGALYSKPDKGEYEAFIKEQALRIMQFQSSLGK